MRLGPLFGLSVMTLPVYLWSSGGMQIGHILALLLIIGVYFSQGILTKQVDVILGALGLWVLIRELLVVLGHSSEWYLEAAGHVVFTALYVSAISRLLEQPDNVRWLFRGLVAALGVALFGVLLGGFAISADADHGRAIGTFNNPNQLAYFSVCACSIAFLLRLEGRVSGIWLTFMLLVSLFLAAVSLSKAGLISVAVASVIGLFTFGPKRYRMVVGASAAFAVVSYVIYLLYSGALDDFAAIQRLQSIGDQEDDALASRGYALVLSASATDLLVGSSYGGVLERLGHEVHSTPFYFIVTYGVPAGVAFLLVLFIWLRKLIKLHGVLGVVLCFLPPMLYGVTHNGTRFTIFWLLVALTMALRSRNEVAVNPLVVNGSELVGRRVVTSKGV